MKSHQPPLEGAPPQTGFWDDDAHGWVNTISRRFRQGRKRESEQAFADGLDTTTRLTQKICLGFEQAPKMREAGHANTGSGICRVRIIGARRLAAVRHETGRPAGGGEELVAAGVPDG